MILPVPEPVPMPQECNFTKKETLAHVDIFLFFEFLIFFFAANEYVIETESNQRQQSDCKYIVR